MLDAVISLGELRKYVDRGMLESVRVILNPPSPNGHRSFSVAVKVKGYSYEQLLISRFQTPRVWTSFDRLLESLAKLGIMLRVDLVYFPESQEHESEPEP